MTSREMVLSVHPEAKVYEECGGGFHIGRPHYPVTATPVDCSDRGCKSEPEAWRNAWAKIKAAKLPQHPRDARRAEEREIVGYTRASDEGGFAERPIYAEPSSPAGETASAHVHTALCTFGCDFAAVPEPVSPEGCLCGKRPEYSHFTEHSALVCGSPAHGSFLVAQPAPEAVCGYQNAYGTAAYEDWARRSAPEAVAATLVGYERSEVQQSGDRIAWTGPKIIPPEAAEEPTADDAKLALHLVEHHDIQKVAEALAKARSASPIAPAAEGPPEIKDELAWIRKDCGDWASADMGAPATREDVFHYVRTLAEAFEARAAEYRKGAKNEL